MYPVHTYSILFAPQFLFSLDLHFFKSSIYTHGFQRSEVSARYLHKELKNCLFSMPQMTRSSPVENHVLLLIAPDPDPTQGIQGLKARVPDGVWKEMNPPLPHTLPDTPDT